LPYPHPKPDWFRDISRIQTASCRSFRPISAPPSNNALQILVDADACPVKEEIYKVALRHHVAVAVVSNRPLRVPDHPLVRRVVVSDSLTRPTTGSHRKAAPTAW
jgi:hypothetical protein